MRKFNHFLKPKRQLAKIVLFMHEFLKRKCFILMQCYLCWKKFISFPVYLKCHIQYFDIFWRLASLSSWLSWVSHGISVSSSLSPSHIPVVPTMKRYKSLKLHQVDREDGHPWKLSSLLYPLIILSRAAAEKKLKDHIHTPSWKIARKLESSQFLVYFMSIWYKTTKRISY